MTGPPPAAGRPDLSPGGAFDYSDEMSVIVAEVYDALLEAGASEPKARAAAAAIPTAANLATQQDVAAVQQDISAVRQEVSAVRQEVSAVRQELKQDIAVLRSTTPCSRRARPSRRPPAPPMWVTAEDLPRVRGIPSSSG